MKEDSFTLNDSKKFQGGGFISDTPISNPVSAFTFGLTSESKQSAVPKTRKIQEKTVTPEDYTEDDTEEILKEKALKSIKKRKTHIDFPIHHDIESLPKEIIRIPDKNPFDRKQALTRQKKRATIPVAQASGHPNMMCTQSESNRRQESYRLSCFEMKPGLDLDTEDPKVNYNWTVKEYLRSETSDSVVREQPTLTFTIDHILSNILDVDVNGNPMNFTIPKDKNAHDFEDIYTFAQNRLRAVAKDYKKDSEEPNEQFVLDHERLARFYIMSNCEALALKDMSPKLNVNRIRDLLGVLINAYATFQEQGTPWRNEAEFTEYFIILNLNRLLEVIALLKRLTTELRVTPHLQRAIDLFNAYCLENYVRFFYIIKDAPFLVSCMAISLFDSIRKTALEMTKESIKKKTVREIVIDLYFSDENDAIDYLMAANVTICDGFIEFTDEIETAEYRPKHPPRNILLKKNNQSRLYITNGERIEPEYPQRPIVPTIEEIEIPDLPVRRPAEPEISELEILEREPSPFVVLKQNSEDLLEKPIEIPIEAPTEPPVETPQITPPEPLKEARVPRRKNIWKFPGSTKELLKLCENREERLELREQAKKYKIMMKIKKALAEEQARKARTLLFLNRWLKKLFEIYKKERRELERTKFHEQFSRENLNDEANLERFQKIKKRKIEVFSMNFEADELISIADNYSIPYAKICLLSTDGISLYRKAIDLLSGMVNTLRKRGIHISSNPDSVSGSDLVIILSYSDEFLRYHIENVQKVIILLYDHGVLPSVTQKIQFSCKSIEIIKVYDPTFSTKEDFHDLIWYPICKTIPLIEGPFYQTLRVINIEYLINIYYENTQSLPDSIKSALLNFEWDACNLWVNYLNSITKFIQTSMKNLYTKRQPFSNLLKLHSITETKYRDTKESSYHILRLLSWLKLPELPDLYKTQPESKYIFALLYEYAAEFISPFEHLFPEISENTLSVLHGVFEKSFISASYSQNHISGPFTDYFISLFSVVLSYIRAFPYEIIWDTSNSTITQFITVKTEVFMQTETTVDDEFFTEMTGQRVFYQKLNSLR